MISKISPLQVIFKGSTEACLPALSDRENMPAGFHFTMTTNHWSNLDTMKDWAVIIFAPYIAAKRERLGLAGNLEKGIPPGWAVLILDCWGVHLLKVFHEFLHQLVPRLLLKFVPPNCTSKLQPCDVGEPFILLSLLHSCKPRRYIFVSLACQ
jgi:hypothetical protein